MTTSATNGDSAKFVFTDDLKAKFLNDGYLIIPDFFTTTDAAVLKARADELLHSMDLSTHPMTTFATGGKDGTKHVGDKYFLESGDAIRYFFEEDAIDKQTGKLLKPKERAINKIGHALHVLDDKYREFSHRPAVIDIVRKLDFEKPVILQSMLIFKQPEIGGAVPPHQDSTFLHTDPPSAVGFWFALEDCTLQNGCLTFVPGSHKTTPITRRFVRVHPSGEGGTTFEPEGVPHSYEQFKPEDYVVGEVKAGSLVLIHGGISRYIYTFHMIDGALKYDEKNWLQPTKDLPFDNVYEHQH
ncbi:phytanoyl-CoA dioxygenase [Catenaria anguillulae PL171]|uniref:Phytanoyl-CoA dioxygenase n=1 Tax=Catenaria anguillulae PL171 TaxID=765915 RepID=A0A1Y2H4V1_9FUNG|nr:phytanoyl-CoA dioxygenase [Catenaria anguillulae PL171]